MTQLLTDTEQTVQRQVCSYIQMRYPKVIFTSDGSGNFLSRAQAGINKMLRSSAGVPDLMVFTARHNYHGLFLELKREGTRLYTKDGRPASAHLAEQLDMLEALRAEGYAAVMVCGFDEARASLDEYLAG